MTKQGSVLGLLVTLTLLFVFAQLMFVGAFFHAGNLDGIILGALKEKLHYPHDLTPALLRFFAAQVFLQVLYIYLLWFMVISIAEWLAPTWLSPRGLALGLWLTSLIAIVAANAFYLPHSFFGSLFRQSLFGALTEGQLKLILILTSAILALGAGLSLIHLGLSFLRRRPSARHYFALSLSLLAIVIFTFHSCESTSLSPSSPATESRPNIFIIGFDAIRPDYLHFFNEHRQNATPHFEDFLKSSVVFSDTYTPLAKTFPSWASILTGSYPLENHAREDMLSTAFLKFEETLPGRLKKEGYETIYASDDSRFSHVNNALFGFDRWIGPPGNATDYVLSLINDFPLSNLVVTTMLGKTLFPYSYGSHAAVFAYNPDNFLALIKSVLNQNRNKPLFLAAHFNLTGVPFSWFNDHQLNSDPSFVRYKKVLSRSDQQFGDFLSFLKQKGLLEHAIFVLFSDHGITLQMPGDRIVKESLYQGNKQDINKLQRNQYNAVIAFTKDVSLENEEQKVIYGGDILKLKVEDRSQALNKLFSKFNPALYGIDTSFGYGNDVLSLKQYHPILAIRTYGLKPNNPHLVSGRCLLLDLAPTVLDILHLQPLTKTSGISLLPFLTNSQRKLSEQRPIFLENSCTFKEIEHDGMDLAQVMAESAKFFEVNPKDEVISFTPAAQKVILETKQRAILLGDWFLAYYPVSKHYRMVQDPESGMRKLVPYTMPPYPVLVNLKTGQWTTDLSNHFSASAPLKALKEKLDQFYGSEMDYYLS